MRYNNPPQMSQSPQCEKMSMSLAADASRLCDQLGETLGRLEKIGDTLLGAQPCDAACSAPGPAPQSVRSDLDRAFSLRSHFRRTDPDRKPPLTFLAIVAIAGIFAIGMYMDDFVRDGECPP